MAKIQFRIRDKDKKVFTKTSLVMHCFFKNGEPWKSQRLVTNNSGVIWLEIENRLIRRINWETVKYDVRKSNRKLEHSFTPPKKVNPGAYQVFITAQPLQPQSREQALPSISILTAVVDQNKQPISKVTVLARWTDVKGTIQSLPEFKTDTNGRVIVNWKESLVRSVDWKNAKYELKHKSKKFDQIKFNGPRGPKTKIYDYRLDLTAREIVEKPPVEKLSLRVNVYDQNSKPVSNANISGEWKDSSGTIQQFPEFKLNQNGRLELSLEKEIFDSVPWNRISFQASHESMVFESVRFIDVQPINDDSKQWQLNLMALRVIEPVRETDEVGDTSELFRVSGIVLTAKGLPAKAHTVIAYHREICNDHLLGKIETDNKGFYEIEYKTSELKEFGKEHADLIVRIYEKDDPQTESLVSSPLIMSAQPQQQVNLSIDDDYLGTSLFEFTQNKLDEQVKNHIECIEEVDVWLLADRLRLSPGLIAQYVAANKLISEFKIEKNKPTMTMLLFSLLKAGVVDFIALAHLHDNEIRALVKKAVGNNWIPARNYNGLISELRTARIEFSKEKEPIATRLMEIAGVTLNKRDGIYEALRAYQGDSEGFIKVITKNPPKITLQTAKRLITVLEVFEFFGQNLEIINQVYEQTNFSSMQDLVGIKTEKWIEYLTPIADKLPLFTPGRNSTERLTGYAVEIDSALQRRFSSQYFIAEISANDDIQKTTGNFFNKNRNFDFDNQKIEDVFGAANSENQKNQLIILKNIESFYHHLPVVDKSKALSILWSSGLHSPSAITSLGKQQFRKKVSAGLKASHADSIFSAANHIQARTIALETNLEVLSLTKTQASTDTDTVEDKVSQFPSLQNLFGDVISQDCEHCESFTSPSAYLVDLLSFLKRATNNNSKNGLELLRGTVGNKDLRRPDIEQLLLDCANSDVPIPYIDIVLEILENVVAGSMDRVYQTLGSMEEVAAKPEHTDYAAYTVLKNSVYPWSLPFDLGITTSRSYLNELELPRYKLLENLHKPIEHFVLDEAVSCDYLGLTPIQALIVSIPYDQINEHPLIQAHPVLKTLDGEKFLLAYWGLEFDRSLDELFDLKTCLIQTGLDQNQFESIFYTQYVNPDQHVTLTDEDGKGVINSADWEFFDRFHRFSRFHRYSGKSIEDLDLILSSIDLLDETFLVENVASAFRLSDQSGLLLNEVVSWWGTSPVDSIENYASSLNIDDQIVDQFSELKNTLPDTPKNAWQFWLSWQQVVESELEFNELFFLCADSQTDELFSIEQAVEKLVVLQQSLIDYFSSSEDLSDEPNLILIAEQIAVLLDITSESASGYIEYIAELDSQFQSVIFKQLIDPGFVDFQLTDLDQQATVLGIDTAKLFIPFWKQLVLADRLGLEAEELIAVAALSTAFQWINPIDLGSENNDLVQNFSQIMSLHENQKINIENFVPEEDSLFNQIITITGQQLHTTGGQGYKVEDLLKGLAVYMDWEFSDIEYLLSVNGLGIKNNWSVFLELGGLLTIAKALELTDQSGISQEQLWKVRLDFDPAAQTLRDLLEQKYGSSEWLEASARVHDPLRELQRDVLVDYILHIATAIFGTRMTTDELYSFYLIDSQVSSCFDTSRTKQAIASVQLYIQRIMLSLELGGLSFRDPDDKVQWEWRKNYRVWEANRNVFVFPENWLEPEFRDNKTELFQNLEDRLLQDEVHSDTATSALLEYCRDMDKIGNMEIATLYEHFDPDSNESSEPTELHVVARTRALPHVYHHCMRDNITGIWSDWRKIEVDIEGYHLVLIKFNNKLYLIWPSFKERQYSESSKIYDIALNWSEQLDDLTWSAKKFTSETLESGTFVSETRGKGRIYCLVTMSKDELSIGILADQAGAGSSIHMNDSSTNIGSFTLDLCKESFTANKHLFGFSHDMYFYDPASYRVNQKIMPEDGLIYVDQYKAMDTVLGRNYSDNAVFLPLHLYQTQDLRSFSYEGNNKAFIVDRSSDLVADARPVSPFPPNQDIPPIDGPAPIPDPPRFPYPIPPLGPDIIDPDYTFDDILLDSWGEHSDISLVDILGSTTFSNTIFTGSLAAVSSQNLITSNGQLRSVIDVQNRNSSSAQTDAMTSIKKLSTTNLDARTTMFTKTLKSADKFDFTGLYHPFTCTMIRQLLRKGTDGLYMPDWHLNGDDAVLYRQVGKNQEFFENQYDPVKDAVGVYPVEHFEFSYGHPYATYNWEVFYHAPMLIVKHLMRNQQFETAQKWLHYIFDPTATEESQLSYWRFRPFYLEQEEINNGDYTSVEGLRDADSAEFDAQVAVWEANPFNPHAIARLRTVAYMRATVMTYLDNLIAWGDQLFRRDTMESIAEAAQLYIFASQLLGPRPIQLPAAENTGVGKTAQDVVEKELEYLTNAGILVGTQNASSIGSFLSTILEFCLPANDQLLTYWDTIADRLFKIRNCMNIDGVTRSLALYEPPIDPALLVRAAASGQSIDSILNNLSAQRPHYRFTYMLQKAKEFLADVKSMGSTLMSVMEKRDAEEMALLRSSHELTMAKNVLTVRKQQVDESEYNLTSLHDAKATVDDRIFHYQDLLEEDDLDEEEEEQKKLKGAHDWEQIAGASESVASLLYVVPQAEASFPPAVIFGGLHLGSVAKAFASFSTYNAAQKRFKAGKLAVKASRIRRNQEWQFQLDSAILDSLKLETDILGAEVRLALSEKEVTNQETQIANTEQTDAFLSDKFTNQELYNWMVTQISSCYFNAFQMAEELAKSAEQAYLYELGLDYAADNLFINSGHWNSLYKGLQAGENLELDLKRMELSYINKNKRQFELTKTISLLQVAPEALLTLRNTANCSFSIPEQLFDLDFPGHYKRRIKSVSLTLPSLAGPYTTLACTLKLKSASTRKIDDVNSALDIDMTPQSIATSSAQNDSGLFQLDFRDERYLPFEGAGAVSEWEIQLNDIELAQFDYSTISDAILQINYTSDQGSDSFRDLVITNLKTQLGWLDEVKQIPSLLSLKTTFSDQWAKFQSDGIINLEFKSDQLPFLVKDKFESILASSIVIDLRQGTLSNWEADLKIQSTGETIASVLNQESGELGTVHGQLIDSGTGDSLVPLNLQSNGTVYELVFSTQVLAQVSDIKDIYLLNTIQLT